jgi:hypothetical protein
MLNRTRSFTVLACSTLLAGACGDNPTEQRMDTPEAIVEAVRALGFRTDMIEDHGSYLLVEGDIYLPKAKLRASSQERPAPGEARHQYTTTNMVSSFKVNQITVDLSGLSSQPGWQSAARDAIAHWSGVSDANVTMVESSPADITVSTTCTSSNVAAYASFPSAGNPGSTIYVNTCFGYSTSNAQKVHNMVHEFGHTIGFRHSNYTQMGETAGTVGANHVYGTPTSGNATGSVMNGGTALNSWAGFASSDVTAVRARYPLQGPSGISVTNSNGTPLISWNAASGATGYTVSLITFNTTNGNYQNHYFTTLGTTIGTSYLDTGNTYTGVYECNYDWGWEGQTQGMWYEYAVQATYTKGTSPILNVRIYAPIAQC